MILILFFMYIFPLIFLGLPVLRMTPRVATILLFLGLLLWILNGIKIFSFIRKPKKLAKKHQDLLERGQSARAKIIEVQDIEETNGSLIEKILIEFVNLAGEKIRTNLIIEDPKASDKKYKGGDYLDLKLNRSGFEPPFSLVGRHYQVKTPIFLWFWLAFHFVYMIAFFLLSYHFQNEGYGWRFLNPGHPWIWSTITTMIMLYYIEFLFVSDMFGPDFDIEDQKSRSHKGKLTLYGSSTIGKILSYKKTGTHVQKMPQILIDFSYKDSSGRLFNKSVKQVIRPRDLEKLESGVLEVLYLRENPNIFVANLTGPIN
jgi:hypothetical protein